MCSQSWRYIPKNIFCPILFSLPRPQDPRRTVPMKWNSSWLLEKKKRLLSGWTSTLRLSQVQYIHTQYSNIQNTPFLSMLLCVHPSENGEWAIVHRPARKMIDSRYSADDLEYQEIIFNLVIQRKPLFYVINIILPCSLISSLVVLAYFLPAQGQ